jgi:hypothetical protein
MGNDTIKRKALLAKAINKGAGRAQPSIWRNF